MAFGISMLILSFILIALSRAIPKLPPEVGSLLFETGIDNIATIVEELGVKGKAIYLPSSLLTGGQPQALIPLDHNLPPLPITRPLPQRFIVRYGTNPEDIGLLVNTTGTAVVSMLKSRSALTLSEFELALTSLFRGILGVADGARVTYQENHHIDVEIRNLRIENKTTWFHQCLGGPLASAVASVAAEVWNKPVTITQETYQNGKCSIELEVLE